MKIAYLINQYPKVSHSFIRREIIALESLGVTIKRFSVRKIGDELVDDEDKKELLKTRFILELGIKGLLFYLLRVILFQPLNFIKALILTFKIGYRSERGVMINLIYLVEACVLSFWLKQEQIRHIHAHFGTNSTTVAMLTSLLGNISYSFTIHGPEEFDKPDATALSEKIKRATFVVTISNYGKSQVYRWCEYQDWQKVHVIHCGLDEKFIQAEITPIPSENNLVCVGRLCPQKGQLLLLDAIARLKQKRIICQLTLVGDGELRQEIEKLAEKLHIKSQINITGWASSEEVKMKINEAKLMVIPSFAEGLPVVIMESFALGRPVISTYVAGIPELVVENESGWLCFAGDVESLTEKLEKALSLSPEKLNQIGIISKKKVKYNHDIEIEAKKLKNLFEIVVTN
ncbi:glycosyltransferase family 4 protein [Cyanobacterium aponinum AL20118]|uniref:Glycosyltransferase family 4 protein n=1 Tax=Cyanobacterium aponinum AL20115 TaxID=3090662 RepID=A0AAF1C5I8_9CHRO|nr:glycosyltransferase family 4 protein [Cyanobacterium aponinum]WPF87159.1 glycosyltransferase family 4 protein [Cyanobacterium aponinum AL20115]